MAMVIMVQVSTVMEVTVTADTVLEDMGTGDTAMAGTDTADFMDIAGRALKDLGPENIDR